MLRRIVHSWSQYCEAYIVGNNKRIEISVPLTYLAKQNVRIQSCSFDYKTQRVEVVATVEADEKDMAEKRLT